LTAAGPIGLTVKLIKTIGRHHSKRQLLRS